MSVEQNEKPDSFGEDTPPNGDDKLGPLIGFLILLLLFATFGAFVLRATVVFWILLALSIGLMVTFVVLRVRTVLDFFVSRQARYGANVVFVILLVFGIAVIVNVIVAQRFDKVADWTADKRHTLSDQTKKIVQGLKKDVKMIYFFQTESGDQSQQRDLDTARYMSQLYQRETDRLDVEFIDPYADPQKAETYKIEFNGTIVFESGLKREKVTELDEQKFTSAIMKVTRETSKKIYFLTGHEEREIDEFDQAGYRNAKEALEKQNYIVEPLALATTPEIPADCAVLVIPGPKSSLTPHEINEISRYLDGDGKLLVMFEPSLLSSKDPNQGLVDLMNKWGVTVGNDIVFDFLRAAFFLPGGRYPNAPTVGDFEFHQTTQYLYQPVVFQVARSVTPKADIGNFSVKSLAKTTAEIGASWGETKRKPDGTFDEPSYTKGEDTPPPVSLAVAVEATDDSIPTTDEADKPKETKTRLVVVGDADFAGNFLFERGGGDFFLNMINWLTLEEDLISIRPTDPSTRSLRLLTASEAGIVQMTSIFLIPLIVFMVGVVVWWRRR